MRIPVTAEVPVRQPRSLQVPKMLSVANRRVDARSELLSCRVDGAAGSQAEVRASLGALERNVRFPDLRRRACARREF